MMGFIFKLYLHLQSSINQENKSPLMTIIVSFIPILDSGASRATRSVVISAPSTVNWTQTASLEFQLFFRREPQTANWAHKMSDCSRLLDVWKLWMQNTHTHTHTPWWCRPISQHINSTSPSLSLSLSLSSPAENRHQTYVLLHHIYLTVLLVILQI